jgi:hypothetical protein
MPGRLTERVEVWLYSFNLDARWGWVVNVKLGPLYLWEIDPVHVLKEGVWALGPVWKGRRNFRPQSGFDFRTLNSV